MSVAPKSQNLVRFQKSMNTHKKRLKKKEE